MPHSHHWNFHVIFRNCRKYSFYLIRENLSFVYISFKYFLLSITPTFLSSFIQRQFNRSVVYWTIFVTPWTAAHQASLSITNSQSLLRLMSIKLVMPSKHLILCHLLLLLPSILPIIRGFSKESILRIRWPKYWSFSFRISPCNECSELISFRMDWFDLLVVQGTLQSLLKHHSSKASNFRCSAFFIVQFSHRTWLLEKP